MSIHCIGMLRSSMSPMRIDSRMPRWMVTGPPWATPVTVAMDWSPASSASGSVVALAMPALNSGAAAMRPLPMRNVRRRKSFMAITVPHNG